MTEPTSYYDMMNPQSVPANTVIAQDNSTHGHLDIGRPFTEEERQFLHHGRKNPLLRKFDAYDKTFKAELAKEPENARYIIELLSLIQYFTVSNIRFKGGIESYDKAFILGRGLDTLLQLDLFKKTPIDSAVGNMIVRTNANELMRLTLANDETVKIEKGWLVPVWSERDICVW